MKRILSIDWDYFINATHQQRYMLFPDGGNENLNKELQNFVWGIRYQDSKELESIGILKNEYNDIHNILNRFSEPPHYTTDKHKKEMLVTVSHKWAFNFIKERTKRHEEFEVYNIDFHHDMYSVGGEVDCGNWVNHLLKQRPRMKYFWIKREDSDDTDRRYNSCSFESLKELDFDYVFLCRSDCWSPPHLDMYFETLYAFVMRNMSVMVDKDITPYRGVHKLTEPENKFRSETFIANIVTEQSLCVSCSSVMPEGYGHVCPNCQHKYMD